MDKRMEINITMKNKILSHKYLIPLLLILKIYIILQYIFYIYQ